MKFMFKKLRKMYDVHVFYDAIDYTYLIRNNHFR